MSHYAFDVFIAVYIGLQHFGQLLQHLEPCGICIVITLICTNDFMVHEKCIVTL